jgi:uncharacterized membrane protein
VKYQWPEAACVKFEISPETHASGKLRSSILATAWFSAETVIAGGVVLGFVDKISVFMRASKAKSVHRRANSLLCSYN